MKQNTKIKENQRKNSFIQSHKGLFMFFMVVTLIGMGTPLTSAASGFSWDNTQSYDSESKTMTITNMFGLGQTIAKIQLMSDMEQRVIDRGDGVYQQVALLKLHQFNDHYDSLGDTKTYDVLKDMKEINREIKFKYRITIREWESPIYEKQNCRDITYGNGSSNNICDNVLVGYEHKEKYDWIEFTTLAELPKQNIFVGIYADVKPNEKVEWIPDKWFGETIDEWAVWTEILSDQLTHYYTLNESSGLVAYDVGGAAVSNTNNITFVNDAVFVPGKINNSIKLDGTGDTGESETNLTFLNGTGDFAVNLWFNQTTIVTGALWALHDGGSGLRTRITAHSSSTIRVFLASTDTGSFGTIVQDGSAWTMLTVQRNSGYLNVYINGTLEHNESIPGNINSSKFLVGKDGQGGDNFPGEIDEIGMWNRSLSQSEITDLYNGGEGITYAPNVTGITVTLNSPQNADTLLGRSHQFNCSTTRTGSSNISNASLMVDGIANFTNTTIGENISILTNVSGLSLGAHKWTCRGITTENVIGTTANRTFTIVDSLITNETFNASAPQMTSQSFKINVTTNGTVPAGTLMYNGTPHTTTKITTNSITEFTSSFVIPSTTGIHNKSFNWNFSIGDNSTTSIQNVTLSTLGLCNSTLSNTYINFTFKNETTAEEDVNASVTSSTFNYYIDDVDVNKTLIFSNASVNPSYGFCFQPTDRNMTSEISFAYDNDESEQRTFAQTLQLGNTTKNQILYLLPTSEGRFVTFQVVDQADNNIIGATLTGNRTISGTSTIVASGTTDSSGAVEMWLNPNFQHQILAEASGFTNSLFSVTPTESTYTIQLGSSVSSNFTDYTRGMTTTIRPDIAYLTNDTTYSFNFSLNSTFYSVTEFGFVLSNKSGTTYGSVSSSSSGGTVNLNRDVGTNTTILMNYYWVVDGNYTNFSQSWYVFSDQDVNFSIKHFADDLKQYTDDGIFGITPFAFSLLLFLLVFMFVGFMSYQFGLQSPAAVVTTATIIIWILDVGLGLMDGLTPAGAVKHAPAILLTIISATLLYREGTR